MLKGKTGKIAVATWVSVRRAVTSRRFFIWTGTVLGIIILLQLLFPYDRAFFLARIDDQSVGLQTKSALQADLNSRYKNARITTVNPTTNASFTEAGVTPNITDTVNTLTTYPIWQRLIPLSSLYKLFDHEYSSVVKYQNLPMSQWAKKVSEACYQKPTNASIAVTAEQTLAVLPSKAGYECKTDRLVESLKSATLAGDTRVDSRRAEIKPARSDQQVSAQLEKIQKVIDQGITVSVLGAQTKAETSDIVSWLQFRDGKDGALELDIDPEKTEPFIESVQGPVYIAPGTTVITMVDGAETSKQAGAVGRGIDSEKLVTAIRSQLQTLKSKPIEAEVTTLPPKQDIRRSYTNSAVGLQTLVSDLATEKGDMAIAISELGGQGRSANANGTRQYHPASTYKLFIAHSIFKRIEATQLKWEDQINNQSIDQCLTNMIVDSDNACAEAFGEKFTWKAIQADARSIGMSSTDLNRPEPVSAVNDQVLFLKKLHDKQLMKPEHTDKLLALMKQQRFRAGVPAGVSYEVANKVGFMSGLLHDSAIVYGPNGGYIISVYSKGGSWGDIADTTRRINNLINP